MWTRVGSIEKVVNVQDQWLRNFLDANFIDIQNAEKKYQINFNQLDLK